MRFSSTLELSAVVTVCAALLFFAWLAGGCN